MSLKVMYITNDSDVAKIAQKYGVDRIWIDLETRGKEERQRGMDTVKSHHKIEDVAKIKPLLFSSELLVRINPWYEESKTEIDKVIEAGADIIMLPMWRTENEVYSFVKAVGGRCKTILLIETKEAVECLENVLKISGIDEVYIGLNDLHLSYGLVFMFELLTNGTVEKIARRVAAVGLPYGFGGITKIGEGDLLAEKIVLEHYRLGSSRVILSRGFCDTNKIHNLNEIERIFRVNMRNLREYEKIALKVKNDVYEQNRRELIDDVERIVKKCMVR